MPNPSLAEPHRHISMDSDVSPSPVRRVLSLDVVRGITIAFMIMVNNNGGPGSWSFMNHAVWNGLTATDLVFPTFVFVVGISIVFAFDARLARGATRGKLAWHTLQRSLLLILFGIVVNSFPFFHLAHMRFYGVLQRIAVCYLAAGLFYLYDRRAWTKALVLAVALIGYWALLRFAPIPGIGTPGREVPFMDMNRNLVSWLDREIFPHHLYLYAPDHNGRDPEGLLSDLPAIGTALLGVLTGLWLRSQRSLSAKNLGLLFASVTSLALGYLWSLEFPLNKNMWTSSYVLVAGGYSLALLTAVFWVVECKGWRTGWKWPWLVFGSNAIAAYMISELLPGILFNVTFQVHPGRRTTLVPWLFTTFFNHIPNRGWATFAYAVSYTAACFLPVWVLYRKRLFLKV